MKKLLFHLIIRLKNLPKCIYSLYFLQSGKAFIVKNFAKENYNNVIYLDFRENKNLRSIFESSFIVNDLISQITANVPDSKALPYKTLIIFDEVQDCPNARSSLKYFHEDGRYDVICTGSLLGIKGYNQKGEEDVPVGYEEIIYMKPLDFEEFLWANGIGEETITSCRECFKNKTPILEGIHLSLSELFKKYICVGGMPEVVASFIETGDMNQVLKLQRAILESYKDDFGRHLDNNNSIYVDKKELQGHSLCSTQFQVNLQKKIKNFSFQKSRKESKMKITSESCNGLKMLE